MAVEEILLGVARPELYRTNAFRISELPVDAGARDISRRQATTKQATGIGLPIPPGYGRVLPLEEPPDPEAFSEAVQHLGDPERRLVDELFWFWPRQFGESRSDEALALLGQEEIGTIYTSWRQQGTADDPYTLHNLAILSHASALDWERRAFSSTLSTQEQSRRDFWWQEAFRYWRMLLELEAFWSQVTQRIRDLEDPRLTTGMARRLRDKLPLALLLINGQLAVRATEREDVPECHRQIALMRSSGFEQRIVDEALSAAVEPLRERIKALCKMTGAQVLTDIDKVDAVTTKFLDQSQPLLKELDTLLPAGNATRDSMHDEVAQLAMGSMIAYGNKTENWPIIVPLVERIHDLAVGSILRRRIEENLTVARASVALAMCWYCQVHRADKKFAYVMPMYGNVQRSFDIFGRRHVEWQKATVSVSCCQECTRLHTKARIFGQILGMALGAGLALWWGIPDMIANAAHVPVLIAASPGILMLISFVLFGRGLGPWLGTLIILKRKKVRAVHDIKDFPGVARLLSQGWKIGIRPPGVKEVG